MNYLIILNTLAIVFLIVSKKSKYYLSFMKETTIWYNILLGYRIILWKKTSEHTASSIYSIYIKIRNRKKTEMKDDARYMIEHYSQQNNLRSLTAKFSWLKTWKEVNQFKKYYTCVDKTIVDNLVANFTPKVSI